MTEIISGLWFDTNKSYLNKNFMYKIDLPIDCNFNNNQYLSIDLKIKQFYKSLDKIVNYIFKNLNLMKNILIYDSNNNELENSKIILIAFLLKFTKIDINKAIILVSNKIKSRLFFNEYYKNILIKYKKDLN